MANAIELKKINKIYGDKVKTQALFDIDLKIEKGSFVSIIGQSGSGKSTMLNIIGTLDNPTTGEVLIDQIRTDKLNKKELSKLRNEKIGFVFQFHYLLPEFNALDNVLMPYKIKKQKITPEIIERAKKLLDEVGLEGKHKKLPSTLSGGQQQRVAIARSLMNNPSLILADEPTGNLDSVSTNNIYELLREINQKNKTTLIVITHDRKVAERADRIIEIKDGKIEMDVKK